MNSDAEIAASLTAMQQRLVSGGILLVSLRDYGTLRGDRPAMTPAETGFYQPIVAARRA